MRKTLEELLKEPENIGISEIAEFVCSGYDKSVFDVVKLLDAYADSVGREHKVDLKQKDKEISALKEEREALISEKNMYQKKYFDLKNHYA